MLFYSEIGLARLPRSEFVYLCQTSDIDLVETYSNARI